jgi:hypothetical protein
MKILDEGVAIASRPMTDGASACFPNLAVLPNGRWLVAARLAPGKSCRTSRVGTSFSDNLGKTWHGPLLLPDAPPIAGVPGVWRAAGLTPLPHPSGLHVLATFAWEDVSRPLDPMYNEATEGIADMKLFTAISDNGGLSFSIPRLVTCGRFANNPTPITGAALVLSNGSWGVQFEVNQHYNDTAPWQHYSALVFSRDEGRSWSEAAITHTDPARKVFCWDQRLSIMPDGTVLALYWTFDKGSQKYLNIHAARSCDHGRTWSAVWDTGLPGQPSRVASLSGSGGGNRIAMLYVDRTAEPVIKLRVSDDAGKTWPDVSELLVHKPALRKQTNAGVSMNEAWAEMSAFSVGLPDLRQLPNGELLGVCYSGPHAAQTDIRWVRIGE